MSLLGFEYGLTLDFSAPVKDHFFFFFCLPLESASQRCDGIHAEVAPHSRLWRSVSADGVRSLSGEVGFEHERFSVRVRGKVFSVSGADESEPHPMYTAFTPSTVPNGKIREIAGEYFGRESNTKLAADVMERVHSLLEFSPDATEAETTAAAALEMGRGVCQDYAHIFCGIMRCLGVPTRYVAGLGRAEGETHAWNECYIDGKWLSFDPTLGERADESYVKFTVGLDAEHCSLNRGVFASANRGDEVSQKQTVFARVVTLV